jgi:putative spermidine/putrescine transport system ATP-binding protein
MEQVVCLGPELGVGRSAGEPVLIACRPEQLTLLDASDLTAEGPLLEGIVDDVTFLGSVVRIRLRCKDEVIQVDAVSDRQQAPASRGEHRALGLRADACLVLDQASV